jgi:excisionase family DNA binding protein
MSNDNIKRKYLTLKQLAEYSNISVPTLRRYMRHEGLPHFQVNRLILINPEEFDNWMKLLRNKQAAKDAQFDKNLNEILKDFLL